MSGYARIGAQIGERPPNRGLFNSAVEHDACGVAFVARIAGGASHSVVEQGVQALVNLGHRGASGAEPDSGDGAGILLQLPDAFLRETSGFPLPAPGAYGVGMAMLPEDRDVRDLCEAITLRACRAEGLRLLGWRDVPVVADSLGHSARMALPVLRQLFVAAIGLDGAALEGRLLVLRRVIERDALAAGIGRDRFHWSSLSSRTLVYKGMLTAAQLAGFYPDLIDPRVTSTLALVHARFSTNVLPRWDLAQPFRMSAHNGEINTLRGNVNWMRARQSKFRSPHFGDDIAKLMPVLDESGSDSSQFDNALELLAMTGRPIEHAVMMMIPEAWHQNPLMDDERRAFYEFHSSLLEPWDGPAAIVFTDGRVIGATLDRNGLRPARYLVTEDGLVVMASEAGVLDLPEEQIARKWRLEPGRLLLVDTAAGRILDDAAVKSALGSAQPYSEWIRAGTVHLDELDPPDHVPAPDPGTLLVRQQAFGYSVEDLEVLLEPMGETGEEAVGSMGNDTPLAVLSERSLPLFNYFKQLFAQVTNPPIDPIREQAVMSLVTTLGAGGNLLEQGPAQAKRLEMPHPVLTNHDLEKLRHLTQRQFPAETISMVFHRDTGAAGLVAGIERICRLASKQIEAGATVLILSDRHIDASHVPIPSLLATAAVHQHLVREQTRTSVGLVIETGEAREVMHLALLIGYGAEAVNPYLAFETMADLARRELMPPTIDAARAEDLYVQALVKGLRKTIARMGISTIQSYCSAQIFECLGIDQAVVDRYFPNTPSRIGGIGMDVIAAEAISRHQRAFPDVRITPPTLEDRGEYRWRREGEHHQWNPEVIGALQHAVKSGDESAFRRYVALADDEFAPLEEPARAVPASRSSCSRATRRGGTGARHRPPVLDRWNVARVAQQGGARAARDRDEPHRRAIQHRRGRGGSRAVRTRRERRLAAERDQTGGVGALRGDRPLPRECGRVADQDRPGSQTGGGRAAARVEGGRRDRPPTPFHARCGAHLAAPAPRHLLDRGSRTADLGPALRQSSGADQRQARCRSGRRHRGGGCGEGARRSHRHSRLRGRHRRIAADRDQARRRPVGAGAGGSPAGPHQAAAPEPGHAAGRRSDEDRA